MYVNYVGEHNYSIGKFNALIIIIMYASIFHILLGAIPRLYYDSSSISAGPVLLDHVRCIGNESRLLSCTHNGIGVISSHSCLNYYAAAGVQCLGNLKLLLAIIL